MCICVTHTYIKLNHCAVHLKLTRYCKSTTLQLKKKRKAKDESLNLKNCKDAKLENRKRKIHLDS